jgi:hypothetical protein
LGPFPKTGGIWERLVITTINHCREKKYRLIIALFCHLSLFQMRLSRNKIPKLRCFMKKVGKVKKFDGIFSRKGMNIRPKGLKAH